jgi:hypothetical protein
MRPADERRKESREVGHRRAVGANRHATGHTGRAAHNRVRQPLAHLQERHRAGTSPPLDFGQILRRVGTVGRRRRDVRADAAVIGGDDKRVNRYLARLGVDLQLEAVGEQHLEHREHGIHADDGVFGLGLDIEAARQLPVGAVDLEVEEVIGDADEVS